MKVIQIIAAVFLVGMMSFMHYMTISVLLKNKNNLTEVKGRIIDKYLVKHQGGRSSYEAWILILENNSLKYAVQDNKDRAFLYISNHDIINKNVTILYDQNGYSEPDITFHLYEVSIDNVNIMTMDESKLLYKGILIMVIALDLLIIALYYRAKKLNKPFWR